MDRHATIDNKTGYHIEVAIPWSAATDSASVDIHNLIVNGGGTVIGFDVAASDGDSDDLDNIGGVGLVGGAQAFWDLDDPIGTGNEDNAFQNRRVFGFISLVSPVEGCFVSIEKISKEFISVAPNPASGNIIISHLEGFHHGVITNLLGQAVRSIDITGDKANIDIADLPAGIYFFRPDNAKYAVKIVKQ